MANYRRRRPKQHSVTTCGKASCKYDMGRMQTNGVNRYPNMYWKKATARLQSERRPWRYEHKNIDPRLV